MAAVKKMKNYIMRKRSTLKQELANINIRNMSNAIDEP